MIKKHQDTKKASEKELILIAEDDLSSYIYFEVLLKEKGFRTLHASNGEEAIRQCRKNPNISLLLLDLKMPFVDGYEAVRQIREFNKRIPIIAQTAYAFKTDRERILAAGCSDYISKPIDQELLMKKIRYHLSRDE
ncbi:MAG: response regulator [Candidatus Marinimicrobia bacterium]|nr:response regulator [Candidatus Neomarinimicrobiota bacterium]